MRKQQLNSALKKSLTAEQQSVTEQNPIINNSLEETIVAAKPTTTTPRNRKEKKIAIATPVEANPNNEVKQVIENIKQSSSAKQLPTTQTTDSPIVTEITTHHLFANSDKTLSVLNQISSKSTQLVSNALDSISSLNIEISNYLTNLTQVRQINDLASTHLDFINKLTEQQQHFFEQTIDILSKKSSN